MRPNAAVDPREVYECFDCGARFRDVESRFCDDCGGTLNNLGRSRDL